MVKETIQSLNDNEIINYYKIKKKGSVLKMKFNEF